MTDKISIVHNNVLNGWYVVRGPSHTPISGKFNDYWDAYRWLRRSISYISPKEEDKQDD